MHVSLEKKACTKKVFNNTTFQQFWGGIGLVASPQPGFVPKKASHQIVANMDWLWAPFFSIISSQWFLLLTFCGSATHHCWTVSQKSSQPGYAIAIH